MEQPALLTRSLPFPSSVQVEACVFGEYSNLPGLGAAVGVRLPETRGDRRPLLLWRTTVPTPRGLPGVARATAGPMRFRETAGQPSPPATDSCEPPRLQLGRGAGSLFARMEARTAGRVRPRRRAPDSR